MVSKGTWTNKYQHPGLGDSGIHGEVSRLLRRRKIVLDTDKQWLIIGWRFSKYGFMEIN